MNRKVWADFLNRFGGICLGWEFLTQLIVGLSTWAIINASAKAVSSTPQDALLFLCIFVGCLTVVYLPNAIGRLYLVKWQRECFKRFVDRFVGAHQGNLLLSRDGLRNKTEPWLTTEARAVYNESCETGYEMFSTFFNSVVNIAVVGFILDASLIVYYAGATMLLFVVHKLTRNVIRKASLNLQSSRNAFSQALLRGFANIVNPTKIFRSNWLSSFQNKNSDLVSKEVHYSLASSVVSFLGTVVALSIVVYGVGSFLLRNLDETAAFVAMLVTIPRQIQIIQSGFYFFGLSVHWSGLSSRVQEVNQVGLRSYQYDFKGDISWSKIRIEHPDGVISGPEITDLAKLIKGPGRWTIRGENGSGKSTLLAALCQNLEGRVAFIPTVVKDLYAYGDGTVNDSSGQTIKKLLGEIFSENSFDFLLVDEWDANLDEANKELVDKKLSEIARAASVIEVRHRL